jgi:hypothetical protein
MAAVRAELGVQMAHVRPDGVPRDEELIGDLSRRQVGGQVAEESMAMRIPR